jgi:hypothetical protein
MSDMSRRLPLAAAVALVLATSASARAEIGIKTMPWDDCLAAKAEMQARLDVGPKKAIDIVKSAALDVTRLCTKEGTVAISCSKVNQTLIVSVRPQQSEMSCLWRSLVVTDT